MSVLRTGAKSDLTASRVHVKMNPPSSRLPANRSVKAAGFYPLAPRRRVAVNHRGAYSSVPFTHHCRMRSLIRCPLLSGEVISSAVRRGTASNERAYGDPATPGILMKILTLFGSWIASYPHGVQCSLVRETNPSGTMVD